MGDDRARACATCQRTVHAVEALSLAEATELKAEGACFVVKEARDGRVLTRDGWRRWGAAAVVVAIAGCAGEAPEVVAPAAEAAPVAPAAETCDEDCREMLTTIGYVE